MDLSEFYEAHAAQETTDFRFVALLEYLGARLRGKTVADIGCGTGALARALAGRGWEVLAIEPDRRLHALAARASTASGGVCRLRQAGIEDLGAEDLAARENVLLIDVLEHVEEDAWMLSAVWEKMAPGAQLLCLLPALEGLYGRRDREVGHHRRYSRAAAERLFGGVPFRTVDYRYWNLLGVPVYWFCERILGRCVPESFRQGPRSPLRGAVNAGLLSWFRLIENRIAPPWGLSLLVTAVK
ncbi:MAG: methyltransferase domain-containing protein [Elusimicrobiota bacterium]